MADEVTIDATMRIDNEELSFTKRETGVTVTETEGTRYSARSTDVNTVSSNLDIDTEITTAGISMFINHSNNNSITLTTNVVLRPGEVAMFRPDSTTIPVVSNSSTARLEWFVNQN